MTHSVKRRTLAKGAAWSVPVIATGAAAPAMAASLSPELDANNTVTYNETPDGATSGDNQFRVYSAPDDQANVPNVVSSCGPEVSNATSSTTVTNVQMTFWLPQSDLTFVNNGEGQATSGWSLLTRDASQDGSHVDTAGSTLYAYSSSYSGSTVLSAGNSICLGVQNWISTNSDAIDPISYDANLVGLVDGAQQSAPGVGIPLHPTN